MQFKVIFATGGLLLWLLLAVSGEARRHRHQHGLGRRAQDYRKTRYGYRHLSTGSQEYQKTRYGYRHLSTGSQESGRRHGRNKNYQFETKNLRPSKNENGYKRRPGKTHRKNESENGSTPVDRDNLLVGCTYARNPRQYRTIDGAFNNRRKPAQGASETPYVQIFPPVYDDGANVPRGTDPDRLYNGFPLPLPRAVTTAFRAEAFENDTMLTDIGTHFFQFVAIDTLGSPFISCPELVAKCAAACQYQEPCLPVVVPDDDPFLDKQERCNINNFNIRTSPICGTGTTEKRPKNILNVATSYLDASQIYGSSQNTAIRLRDPDNIALLRAGTAEYATSTGKPLLQLQTDTTGDLVRCPPLQGPSQLCFVAGTRTFNGNIKLVLLYTLFSREHNRLALRLGELNPFWQVDRVYQEARKIVGATLQHIVYAEYLPTVFPDADAFLGKYRGYDRSVDASVSDGFSFVTRLHNLLRPFVDRLGADYQPVADSNDLPLRQTIVAPQLILDNGLDVFIRGSLAVPSVKPSPLSLLLDDLLSSQLTELSAIDIQRSRDRGLANYNSWRSYCGLPSCDDQGFDCYKNEIGEERVRDRLEKLYGNTKNVELWIGGQSEDSAEGETVGPTFKCIFFEQFRRTRGGDSFWYEREGVFPPEQLAEIRKTSLARIICDNSDAIDRVPENVFRLSDPDTYVSCDSIKEMNLDAFKDLDTCQL